MSSCSPPYNFEIFRMPKSEWCGLSVVDLLRVMLYTFFLKRTALTDDECDGRQLQRAHDELPESSTKRTFFWNMSLRGFQSHEAYTHLTYRLMTEANSVVTSLFKQEGVYLPFICKICELFGVPPEVLAIQSGTTTVSKVAELWQYLRHRSETFDDWTCVCRSEETLQSLKDYRRLLQFLQRIVTDRTFALCEEECQELQLSLSSLEGPHTDKFIFAWIHSVMLSGDMINALSIDDWQTRGGHLVQVSDKLQGRIVKIWKHTLSKITEKKDSLKEMLVFLANVLPFLIKTKHFLIDEELKESVSTIFSQLIIWNPSSTARKSGVQIQVLYDEIIKSCPETFGMFPETFEKFSCILLMTVSTVIEYLDDVKALQNNPNASLTELYRSFD
jgi:hypothetical protein